MRRRMAEGTNKAWILLVRLHVRLLVVWRDQGAAELARRWLVLARLYVCAHVPPQCLERAVRVRTRDELQGAKQLVRGRGGGRGLTRRKKTLETQARASKLNQCLQL